MTVKVNEKMYQEVKSKPVDLCKIFDEIETDCERLSYISFLWELGKTKNPHNVWVPLDDIVSAVDGSLTLNTIEVFNWLEAKGYVEEVKTFDPVLLTLNTQEELDILWHVTNCASATSFSKYCKAEKLDAVVSISHKRQMWSRLDAIRREIR